MIWIPVEAYPDDVAAGMVALVHASKRALSVVGLGMVRLPASAIKLELASMHGEDVLFAQGTACETQSAECSKVAKALVIESEFFIDDEQS